MPKDLLKDLTDRLSGSSNELQLSDPPPDYDHSKDTVVKSSTEKSFRTRGGKISEFSDRLQNQAVKELELGKALKEGKKKAPRVASKFEPTELLEPMSADELAARTKQALKANAADEAGGIQALRRSRADYKAKLNKTLSEGKQWNPPGKPAIMPTVLTRESKMREARFQTDLGIHNQFQSRLREQAKGAHKQLPNYVTEGLKLEAPSRAEIPEPKKVRLSGELGPMRPVAEPPKAKVQPLDKGLGNLETKSVYPTLNRDLSRVFNEPYKGDRPRGEIPKNQLRTWLLRLKPVGGSKAEETSSAYMDKIIEGAKTSTDAELKDVAKRLRGGATQASIDKEMASKGSATTTGKPVSLSGDTGEEGIKRYKETVQTPVKLTPTTKDMLSGKAAELPGAVKLAGVEKGAVALSDASKIVKAAEAGGEAVSLASKSSKLAALLGKGAGKAGMAALVLGAGMAGLKKIGSKLRE